MLWSIASCQKGHPLWWCFLKLSAGQLLVLIDCRLRSCSIDDVIVYGRNELWVIKKHMVKCRVESVVVCIYFG